MSVEVKTVGDVKIICIMKRFDAYTANQVEAELTRLIAEGARKIVCDFSQTEYLASAGLRVLITATRSLPESRRQNGALLQSSPMCWKSSKYRA